MSGNVVFYQVDTAEKSTGKIVASSKRSSTWHYGISSIANGSAIGASCRGEEHEVSLGWSVTSGKRQVFHDGEEIYYSIGRRSEGKFHLAWRHSDCVFNLIATAAIPNMKEKQFQLRINGISFDSLPKIYELGTEAAAPNGLSACQFATDFRTDHDSRRHDEDDYRKQDSEITSNDSYIDLLFDNLASDIVVTNSEQTQKLTRHRSLNAVIKKSRLDNLPKRRSLKDVMMKPVLDNLSKRRSVKDLMRNPILDNLSKRRSFKNAMKKPVMFTRKASLAQIE
jgi:hypothetical protein